MSPRRRLVLLVLFAAGGVSLLSGCSTTPKTLREAFPPARVASPWVAEGEVWEGTFEAARPGLGADAEDWARYQPARVWLARYTHEEHADRVLTVRCFAFEDIGSASRAYLGIAPLLAQAYSAGDEGCWTPIGVMFRSGRLVFDIFGSKAAWSSEVESSLLAAHILKRMPPGVAEDPR